jgi:hypothetical protein
MFMIKAVAMLHTQSWLVKVGSNRQLHASTFCLGHPLILKPVASPIPYGRCIRLHRHQVAC